MDIPTNGKFEPRNSERDIRKTGLGLTFFKKNCYSTVMFYSTDRCKTCFDTH